MKEKTYTTKEVMDRLKKKHEERLKNNPPKMVYEVDYKRLERDRRQDRKRSEACLDALITELDGVREALHFVEWDNKRLLRKNKQLKERVAQLTPPEVTELLPKEE